MILIDLILFNDINDFCQPFFEVHMQIDNSLELNKESKIKLIEFLMRQVVTEIKESQKRYESLFDLLLELKEHCK
jgi:hypothetical protein